MTNSIHAGLLLAAGIFLFVAPVNAQTALSLGTSTVGARFHILAVGMGDTVSRNSDISVTVEPIGASAIVARGDRGINTPAGLNGKTVQGSGNLWRISKPSPAPSCGSTAFPTTA